MSALLKKTVWTVICGGCLAEHGKQFIERQWAANYSNEHPLCPDCDGEDY